MLYCRAIYVTTSEGDYATTTLPGAPQQIPYPTPATSKATRRRRTPPLARTPPHPPGLQVPPSWTSSPTLARTPPYPPPTPNTDAQKVSPLPTSTVSTELLTPSTRCLTPFD
ncbi:uncharacterized protein SCHCODRAFT_02643794 [Schizophyllum commune H4-8]|uniref:uncharacterized protein n=1 Tax=Schizophyllum commune (strain H4-8 / FGSC 9210) TaxID=578458 RepID=UPI00215FE1A6|nr:uncharacterized protein SCHCODRAFT_02643794 [Schizophyllum commune H4-8]KAI5885563.1 hypothetical protein SCHCODRAFT_02643794 [Schizophyllum commune H4-8]